MSKSPRVYLVILAVWAVLFAFLLPTSYGQAVRASQAGWPVVVLAVTSAVFIAYFWLNGTKDIVYTLYYHLVAARRPSPVPRRRAGGRPPKVVLVYCTCNDFSADSLLRSMRQRYDDVEVVILDDSSKPEYLAAVDAFAAEHGVRVVSDEIHAPLVLPGARFVLRSDRRQRRHQMWVIPSGMS